MAKKNKSGKQMARKRARRHWARAASKHDAGLDELPREPQLRRSPVGLLSVFSADGSPDEDQQGLVAGVHGRECAVLTEAGAVRAKITCQDQPVVGDIVGLQQPGGSGHLVTSVRPRRSRLSRMRVDRTRPAGAEEHVLAANVDVAVIVASTTSPPFRPRLIDRYLVMCQYGGVEPMICLNKCDLAPPDERALRPYSDIGVTWLAVSAEEGTGMGRLRDALLGRVVVFAGHSGVGKSSLANQLLGTEALSTGGLSTGARTRGTHTTTTSVMRAWAPGSFLIDTPGVRGMGLWEVDAETLRLYFPEFEDPAGKCRFADCSHRHEPDCGVGAAVARGEIAAARYDSYLRMLEEDK